jgi:hypothetical protein
VVNYHDRENLGANAPTSRARPLQGHASLQRAMQNWERSKKKCTREDSNLRTLSLSWTQETLQQPIALNSFHVHRTPAALFNKGKQEKLHPN